MKRHVGLLCLAALLVATNSRAQQPLLQAQKPIGVTLQTDKFHWMSFVAFNSDGKQVASDGATGPEDVSGNLSFWSFPEGRLIRKLPVKPGILSPDWKYYATFHGIGQVDNGKAVLTHDDATFCSYAFSLESKYAAESCGSKDKSNNHIRIIELPSGKQFSAFGKRNAFSLAISPDGVTLAAGYWDVVTLWNLQTGARVGVLSGFGRYVEGLAFSKDGALLAAGTDTTAVQIWDVQQQTRLQSLQLEGGNVSTPVFSPDGRLLAFGIYGAGSVWVADVATGKILDHRIVSGLGCGSVAFSPDGKYLITPSSDALVTWPYDRGGRIRVFKVGSH